MVHYTFCITIRFANITVRLFFLENGCGILKDLSFIDRFSARNYLITIYFGEER